MKPIGICSIALPLVAAAAALIPSSSTPEAVSTAVPMMGGPGVAVVMGNDFNSDENPFVQPLDPALSGGGRDQSQQFFDVLFGDHQYPSVIVGLLGADLMVGRNNFPEVFVGGPEHFNPNNRDKAFGSYGDDTFLWSPGDGSDRFDGGPGIDTVVFGLLGENDQNGQLVFRVSNDQQAGDLYLDPVTSLPLIDVTNSPGFCEIIDGASAPGAQWELNRLGVDHLVRFSIRGVRDAFDTGSQNTDNGLRVTLHLKDVEFVVCTSRTGGAIEVYDLRQSPPQPAALWQLPPQVAYMVR